MLTSFSLDHPLSHTTGTHTLSLSVTDRLWVKRKLSQQTDRKYYFLYSISSCSISSSKYKALKLQVNLIQKPIPLGRDFRFMGTTVTVSRRVFTVDSGEQLRWDTCQFWGNLDTPEIHQQSHVRQDDMPSQEARLFIETKSVLKKYRTHKKYKIGILEEIKVLKSERPRATTWFKKACSHWSSTWLVPPFLMFANLNGIYNTV